MPSILVGAFTGIVATYIFLKALLQWTQDPKEPLPVDTTLPFIGPLISMGRGGSNYWTGPQRRLPMYTLRLPGIRIYIVNSTSLIQPVQRQVRTVSFSPILVQMAKTIMAVSQEAYDIISKDPIEDYGFVLGVPKANHPTLSPGPKLDALNRKTVQIIAMSLGDFAAKHTAQAHVKVSMYAWVSEHIMSATTEGVYGPGNPFRDPKVRKIWPVYEKGLIPLMTGVLPTLTASKYVKARELLVSAYKPYYEEEGYNDPHASAFIKERHTYYSGSGIPLEDIARIEVATSVGLLSNSMPATFWLIFHIFSNLELLQSVRDELAEAITWSPGDDKRSVDLGYVKNRCPILLATFQEVFRYHGMGVSSRWVLDDHMLDGQFLLKKGSILLIPAAVQHNLDSEWGDHVNEFDHTRFLPQPDSKRRRHSPVAFRGFGGGSTLCPGRHFAATEILAFAAFIILQFDARPCSGEWTPPTWKNTNPATSIHQPDHDLDIEITPRDDIRWEVNFSGSDKAMEVSAEDMVAAGAPER